MQQLGILQACFVAKLLVFHRSCFVRGEPGVNIGSSPRIITNFVRQRLQGDGPCGCLILIRRDPIGAALDNGKRFPIHRRETVFPPLFALAFSRKCPRFVKILAPTARKFPAMAMIECVPNFSEGRNPEVMEAIVQAIRSVPDLQLLHVDMGISANRTVVTFTGSPEAVIEGAFRGIETAATRIDMRRQQGTHPRIGATDVCPLVPVKDISLEETVVYARMLAERVGRELHIPVYLYEAAASRPERCDLAAIRKGGYEAMADRMKLAEWQPDFGSTAFNARTGATVIGARNFLLAYNINLNTTDVAAAQDIAAEVRQSGRVKKVRGSVQRTQEGRVLREPGLLPFTKAIGWYVAEYQLAQVSMNLTDLRQTPLHLVYETVRQCAEKRGLQLAGSEIIGLVPLACLLEAGKYFIAQNPGQQSPGSPHTEVLINEAVRALGLDSRQAFVPEEKILEYAIEQYRVRS